VKSSSRRSERQRQSAQPCAQQPAGPAQPASGIAAARVSTGDSLALLVKPRAARNRVVGLQDDRLVLQLQAPPVDGAANAALLRFLAARLGVPHSRVELVRGSASRHKWIRVEGYTAAELQRQLLDGL
jgi:hypothetical protein